MFEPKQLQAIDLYAQGMKGTEIATTIDIRPETLSRWRQDPAFLDAIYTRSRELLKDSLPNIYKVLIAKALEGSYAHAKLILEHLDNVEKNAIISKDQTIQFIWKTDDKTD